MRGQRRAAVVQERAEFTGRQPGGHVGQAGLAAFGERLAEQGQRGLARLTVGVLASPREHARRVQHAHQRPASGIQHPVQGAATLVVAPRRIRARVDQPAQQFRSGTLQPGDVHQQVAPFVVRQQHGGGHVVLVQLAEQQFQHLQVPATGRLVDRLQVAVVPCGRIRTGREQGFGDHVVAGKCRLVQCRAGTPPRGTRPCLVLQQERDARGVVVFHRRGGEQRRLATLGFGAGTTLQQEPGQAPVPGRACDAQGRPAVLVGCFQLGGGIQQQRGHAGIRAAGGKVQWRIALAIGGTWVGAIGKQRRHRVGTAVPAVPRRRQQRAQPSMGQVEVHATANQGAQQPQVGQHRRERGQAALVPGLRWWQRVRIGTLLHELERALDAAIAGRLVQRRLQRSRRAGGGSGCALAAGRCTGFASAPGHVRPCRLRLRLRQHCSDRARRHGCAVLPTGRSTVAVGGRRLRFFARIQPTHRRGRGDVLQPLVERGRRRQQESCQHPTRAPGVQARPGEQQYQRGDQRDASGHAGSAPGAGLQPR